MNRAKNRNTNMTAGSITKLLIVFSIPMLIGNLFQQIYNVVDSVIVGQYVGANALGAIGATGSVTFLFIALCNGIGAGGGIVASQFFGAGKTEEVRKAITNVAYFMLGIASIVCVVSYIITPWLLRFLKTPDEIILDSIVYLRMMCLGVPLVCIYNYFSNMLRALGDSKGPLYFLILACLINVALDIVLVRGCNLSVFGAALATVISQLMAGIFCAIYATRTNEFFRIKKEDFRIATGIIKETARLGIPMSIQFALIAISCMGLQSVVNSFGPIAVAAFTATSRIEQIVHQPYTSMGQALTTFSGQNYGARRQDRIRRGFWTGTAMMAIMSLVLLVVMQVFGRAIVSLFVNDADVIEMGATGLKITSLFYGLLGMIYVTRGVQNGIGDAAFAFINGVVEVVTRIVFPVFMVAMPMFGVWGIWWSAGLVWAISAIFCILRYVYYGKRKMTFFGCL